MIRRALQKDIFSIAQIDRLSFSGNKPEGVAEKWIQTNFERGNQYQYFVFEKEGKVAGFIGWEIKNGFARAVPVIELEKLAVHPNFRGQGIGQNLISETFLLMKEWIRKERPEAEKMKVFAWSLKGNEKAIELYKNICNEGVQGERNLFSESEVFLLGTHEL